MLSFSSHILKSPGPLDLNLWKMFTRCVTLDNWCNMSVLHLKRILVVLHFKTKSSFWNLCVCVSLSVSVSVYMWVFIIQWHLIQGVWGIRPRCSTQWAILLSLIYASFFTVKYVNYFQFLFFMFMVALPPCLLVYHLCVWDPWGTEEVVEFLELMIQVVLKHNVGAKDWIQVLRKSNQWT